MGRLKGAADWTKDGDASTATNEVSEGRSECEVDQQETSEDSNGAAESRESRPSRASGGFQGGTNTAFNR